MSIRILLADDHKIIQEGLRALVAEEADMEVVAEAEDGRTAVQLARKLSPDVIVMDITMPGLNGIEATRQILRDQPRAKVIALSMHSDKQFAARMLEAGARGYVLKDVAFEELATAVRTVAAGRIYLCSQITGLVVEDYVQRLPETELKVSSPLSPREREVLQLLAEGKATKEAARILHRSVKTVETHRRNIMEKLGLYSIPELTKYAIREGLTSLEG